MIQLRNKNPGHVKLNAYSKTGGSAMFQHNLFSVQWTGSWKAHCCHHFESVRFRLCMTFAFQVDWSQDQDSSWAFPRQITFASIWVKSNRISVFECSNLNISLMGDVHFTNSFWVSAWFFSCQIVRVHYKAEEKSLQHTYTIHSQASPSSNDK